MSLSKLHLFLFLIALVTAAIYLYEGVARESTLDEGNGLDLVDIPKPIKCTLARPIVFMVAIALVSIAAIVFSDAITTEYIHFIALLAGYLVVRSQGSPLQSAGQLAVAIRLLSLIDFPILALVMKAPLRVRIKTASHGLIVFTLLALVDALESAIATATHLPIGPFAIQGSVVVIIISTAVYLRFLQTTFVLPKKTAVPRPKRWTYASETASLSLIVLLLIALLGAGLFSAASLFSIPTQEISIISILAYPSFYTLSSLILLVAFAKVRPGGEPEVLPPLEIIMPAYNEEASIALVIDALDAAAKGYKGQVTLIVGNDGSGDNTSTVARNALLECRYIQGRVIDLEHQGKGFALNGAFNAGAAEIVIRIDADIIIEEESLAQLPKWFTNPQIGVVGALPSPRTDNGITWFDKMRRFEELKTFGFNLLAQSRLRSINCIPGTFVAFRRSAAVLAGGFVHGMNGEDADFTMGISRLGYAAVVDTKIKIQEDVPSTLTSFREQRVRWNRAIIHSWARHNPLYAGGVGPRTWFFYPKMHSIRALSLARGMIPIWIGASAITQWHLAIHALVATAFAEGINFGTIAVITVRYAGARTLASLPSYFIYALIKRLILIEALLTLPLIADHKSSNPLRTLTSSSN
ncbi:MAG: glycosyltransferase [Actinomycetota bacterium]|nr:glycosyltransferase [Actinomycetota bacterium]